MNSRAYEDFTDRLYPIANILGWAAGILTAIILVMLIALESEQLTIRDLAPRTFKLLGAPIILGLVADGTVRAIGFLFAPRSVYLSFRGQTDLPWLEFSQSSDRSHPSRHRRSRENPHGTS